MTDQDAAIAQTRPAGVWSRIPLWAKVATPIVVVLVIVAAVAVAGLGQKSKFQAAVDGCEVLVVNGNLTVGDGGRTLTLNGAGDTSGGLAIDDLACVLGNLHVSDAVIAKMDGTRALDGMQTGSWDDIDASWTYHPDDGLDVILTQK